VEERGILGEPSGPANPSLGLELAMEVILGKRGLGQEGNGLGVVSHLLHQHPHLQRGRGAAGVRLGGL
jgi:hypothetical protein